MTTTSVSGAAGGGVAIVPSVAVSLSTVTTDASLGTGVRDDARRGADRRGDADGFGDDDRVGLGVGVDGGGRCGGCGDGCDARRVGDDEARVERDGCGVVHGDGFDLDERLGDGFGEGDVELGAVGWGGRSGRG